MRRATFAATLLGALLAAPSVARAQGTPLAGQVTFDNLFIGAEGCSSTATTQHTVSMRWQDQVDAAAVGAGSTSGVFRIYATNVQPTANADGAQFCQTQNNPNNNPPLFTGQVGSDIPNSGGSLSGLANSVSTSEIATHAGYGDCTQNGQPIYVCVQFYPYVSGQTLPQATPTAWAVGTLTLSLTVPSAVHLDEVLPGDGALNVSWTDNASPKAAKYKVRAFSLLDPTALPSTGDFDPASAFTGFDPRDPSRHETGFITGTGPYRMEGLVNDLVYAVAVVAYSAAETPSDPSNVLTAQPQLVKDFWDTYKADGGQETGGCASGAAGPVGLGLLLATLALVRRRK